MVVMASLRQYVHQCTSDGSRRGMASSGMGIGSPGRCRRRLRWTAGGGPPWGRGGLRKVLGRGRWRVAHGGLGYLDGVRLGEPDALGSGGAQTRADAGGDGPGRADGVDRDEQPLLGVVV